MEPALSTAQTVQAHLEAPFESMENLLMTISPMFRDRFQQALYDKLQSVQTQQQLSSTSQPSATLHQQQIFAQNHAPNNANNINNSDNNIQNLHNSSNDVAFDELNRWIN